MFKYLFGPVLSRRLGISLGVDLLPYKTCSYDCVYCECSTTTKFDLEREEFFPLKDILEELKEYLDTKPSLDYITFSGSGEPTLYSRIGEIISFLKKKYPRYKLALLTNSSLLTDIHVREEIKELDLCVPSLDSATNEGFKKIDRPGPDLKLNIHNIIEGIKKTAEILRGETWIEIFIVPGINDTTGELKALRQAVDYIKPNKVQVNSLDRPGTEKWVEKLTNERKIEIRHYLRADILDIKNEKFRIRNRKKYIPFNTLKGMIVTLLIEKEQSLEELSRMLEIGPGELSKVLYTLEGQGFIKLEEGRYGVSG